MTLQEYLLKKYVKSTLKRNLYSIKRFTDYFGHAAPKARYKDILKYIEYLRKNYELLPASLQNYLYGVKIYFNYLLDTGQRQDHPCSRLYLKDKIDKQIQVDNLYSFETLENFYETYPLPKDILLENRNKIILSLLIYQALTVTEVVGLTIGDINLDKAEIYIKGSSETNSKSPKSRILPLQAKQMLLFYNYLYKDRKHLHAIQSTSTFLLSLYGKKIASEAVNPIINKNRPKSERIPAIKIRQSVIAHMLKKENDTRIVQVFAGHKNASTTGQYKLTELETLQNAVNQFHPLASSKIT